MLSHTLSHYILNTSSGKRKTVHSPYSLKRRNLKILNIYLQTPPAVTWNASQKPAVGHVLKRQSCTHERHDRKPQGAHHGVGEAGWHTTEWDTVSRAPSEASASGRHDHPQCYAPVPETCVVRCDSIVYLLNKRTDTCNKGVKSPSFRKVKRAENARRRGWRTLTQNHWTRNSKFWTTHQTQWKESGFDTRKMAGTASSERSHFWCNKRGSGVSPMWVTETHNLKTEASGFVRYVLHESYVKCPEAFTKQIQDPLSTTRGRRHHLAASSTHTRVAFKA